MRLAPKINAWLSRLTRPRQAEMGAIVLDRRRIYILPTRAGFLYLATLFVMLLGAINYDLALGHALIFLLASLGLVGMLHTHRNLTGISITARDGDPVTAGEMAFFPVRARNPGERPRLGLEWSDSLRSQAPVEQSLSAKQESSVQIPFNTQDRGWITLPPLRLATRYPLGLFQAWATPWPQARCLVYPRPRFTPLPPGQAAGHTGQRQGREGQEDFAGLRERQPADSPRHIAWKAAARDTGNRPLLVKTFTGSARDTLWLDWELTQGDKEQRISQLAGWVVDAEAADLEYGLRLPNQQLPLSRGPGHKHRCLEALALYPR